jgi:hypothetical protein
MRVYLLALHLSAAGCGDIDPYAPCMCERVSTPSNEGYARIMLRGSTTLKTAVAAHSGSRLALSKANLKVFNLHVVRWLGVRGWVISSALGVLFKQPRIAAGHGLIRSHHFHSEHAGRLGACSLADVMLFC